MAELSPERLSLILWSYLRQDIFLLAPALLAYWALWRYWLAGLAPALKLPQQRSWRKWLGGLGLGAGLALAAVVPGLLAGQFSPQAAGFTPYGYAAVAAEGPGAPGLAALFGLQSLYEELLFRALAQGGFALLLLWQAGVLFRLGSAGQAAAPFGWRARAWFWCGLAANLAVAFAFSSVHLGNPGITPLAGASIALAGLLLGQLAWNGGALWGAWGTHWGWNLALALLGCPVSGIALGPGPFGGPRGAASGLLTGGSFGPEASLPATLLLAAAWAWQLALGWRAARDAGAPAPTLKDVPAGQPQAG
jgi:membrane protease YdiL (CAAX protease family)